MIPFLCVSLRRFNIVANSDKNLIDGRRSTAFNTRKETVSIDSMDHTCLKKTKAAQHRAISLKLHWNVFKIHSSEMILAEIHRGYYMAARRYEISLRVLKNISREQKFRISKRPCNVLFII